MPTGAASLQVVHLRLLPQPLSSSAASCSLASSGGPADWDTGPHTVTPFLLCVPPTVKEKHTLTLCSHPLQLNGDSKATEHSSSKSLSCAGFPSRTHPCPTHPTTTGPDGTLSEWCLWWFPPQVCGEDAECAKAFPQKGLIGPQKSSNSYLPNMP